MNKKIVVIGAIVIVIIVAVVILILVKGNPPGSVTGGQGGTGTLPIVSTSTPIAIPTSTTITFGTSQGEVTVNNFYEAPTATTTQDGRAVIAEDTADYVITYNVPDSSFAIAILSTPLETARQEAENAFLSMLGISQTDACKLTVYEGVPISVSDEYPGESFPLSFCGGPPTL